MGRKNITDKQVCEAVKRYKDRIGKLPLFSFAEEYVPFPYEDLAKITGEPEKVCYSACERAEKHGLIEYGVSLRTGWLTDKGKELLNDSPTTHNNK